MLENDDEVLDIMSSNESIEYLVDTILICISEFEYELNPECQIAFPEDIEKEIKKNIKLAGRQLFIAYLLCVDDINNTNLSEDVNLDRNRFNFLEEKEIIDGLRYVAVEIVKVQTDISHVSEKGQNRIRPRLKQAYKFIDNINTLFNQ